jgi:K+-transporting ATPase KdpF subunit
VEEIPMLELILAGLIALGLLIYLVYAMLYPENF